MITKRVLASIRWQWVFALSVAMGILNGVYPRTVLLNPIIGLFLCILIWFTNRPFAWWYDCFFFGVLLACTFIAWLISIASCQIVQLAISNYTRCQVVNSFDQLIGIFVFVLIPNAILYVATYTIFFINWIRQR